MMKIGSLHIDAPLVQAPLSGYSDLAMRRIARLHGAPMAFDEVVLDEAVVTPGKLQRGILNVADEDHPVGGQLMGVDPDTMGRAAGAMVEADYDWIDLNFACPVRKVLGRGRGGAMLSRPDLALTIVRTVCDAVAGRRPVTIKLRRGMDDDASHRRDVEALIDGAFEIGIDAAIIHPRTVRQRYAGAADWQFLCDVKRRVGDRVILGSGDLFCAEDVLRMFDRTGVDGVALARGCIGNPWLFAECRALLAGRPIPSPPSVAEQGRTIGRHLGWAIDVHGRRRGSRIMRKFGIKYSELHPDARSVRDAMIRLKTPAEWESVLSTWYDPHKDWPPGRRRTGAGHPIAAGADRSGTSSA